MTAPVPANETSRLKALREYQILDSGAEAAYDDLTFLASAICETPISAISLIDKDRQWFKSKLGLMLNETPREQAFCAHTILEPERLVISDAQADQRFASNPLVTGQPNIRFYAGVPLVNSGGFALGSMCVIDRKPRELSEKQIKALEVLARQVMTQLELRRVASDLAAEISKVKALQGLLPICSFCKGIRNDDGYWMKVEDYIKAHSDANFSHGICKPCTEKHYPGLAAQMDQEKVKH